MVDAADQDFLKSIFLMEAWDTLASLEDGAAQLAAGTEPAWDDLFVVTHRLKGAASLHGFPRVAALAETMEQTLKPLTVAPAGARVAAAAELAEAMTALKSALESVEHGVEPEAPTAVAPPVTPPIASPTLIVEPDPAPAPAPVRDPLRNELMRFFAGSDEIVGYFVPEAGEHLETMTAALFALAD